MQISLDNISYSIGEKLILDTIKASVHKGDKIGIVGKNGSGKSTLLKVMNKTIDPDIGEVVYQKKLKINYLTQNDDFDDNLTIEENMKKDFKNRNIEFKEYEIDATLSKLGLNDKTLKVSSLSGGQRKRVSLAIVLIGEFDVLILDEPTNHLDMHMISWLENTLKKSSKSLILVTHDRYFLERVCNKIFEISNQKLYVHEGNYNLYLNNRIQREQDEQAQLRKKKSIFKTELDWIKQGPKARSSKSKERTNRFYELEKNIDSYTEENELTLPNLYRRIGTSTIELDNISMQYSDKKVFSNFSYNFSRFDRIGIVGINGSGKSTLLNILTSKLNPTQGNVLIGETIKIGYLKQQYNISDKDIRLFEYIDELNTEYKLENKNISITKILDMFLFSKETYNKKISELSGGELKRIELMKVLLDRPNVLILDEPTNDLDIETLNILEEFLQSFLGILIVVSHDRYFLDKVADHFLVIKDEAIIDTLEYKLEPKSEKKEKSSSYKKPKNDYTNKLSYKEKRELETIDDDLEKAETNLKKHDELIAEKSDDYEILVELLEKRDQLQNQVDNLTERWMYLYEKKDKQS